VFTGCLFSLDTSGLKLWFFLSFRDTLAASNGVSHIDLATFFTLMIEMSNFFHPFVFPQLLQRVCEDLYYLRRISVVVILLYSERLLSLISFSAFISF